MFSISTSILFSQLFAQVTLSGLRLHPTLTSTSSNLKQAVAASGGQSCRLMGRQVKLLGDMGAKLAA